MPRALHNLEVLAQKYFKVEPLVAGQGAAEWGIELDVADPKTVGADRVLNVIAAHALYEGDLIIIDFGTATTVDPSQVQAWARTDRSGWRSSTKSPQPSSGHSR